MHGQQNIKILNENLSAGSSVGIATGYGWTVRGSNPGGGRDFPHLGPTQPPVQWVPGLSRGKEWPRRDADPSPPSIMKG